MSQDLPEQKKKEDPRQSRKFKIRKHREKVFGVARKKKKKNAEDHGDSSAGDQARMTGRHRCRVDSP